MHLAQRFRRPCITGQLPEWPGFAVFEVLGREGTESLGEFGLQEQRGHGRAVVQPCIAAHFHGYSDVGPGLCGLLVACSVVWDRARCPCYRSCACWDKGLSARHFWLVLHARSCPTPVHGWTSRRRREFGDLFQDFPTLSRGWEAQQLCCVARGRCARSLDVPGVSDRGFSAGQEAP